MKAAWVHDHYFVFNKHDNKYYDGSGGVFEKNLWKRYLAIFDSLVVIGREKNTLPNKLVDSTYNNVTFELRPELKKGTDRFLKKKNIKIKLYQTLINVDFAIIRLPSVLGYIAQEICEENSIPYTLEVVTCPWDAYWNYGTIAGKLIAPIEYFKLRNATRKSLNTIYVTQKFLQSRYPSLNNQIGISNVLIKNRKELEEIIDFYSDKFPALFKIGLIGSFHVKWKGHVEAIKAISYLVENGINNVKLYLVGSGDSRWVQELIIKEKLNNYVEIKGVLEAGTKGIFPFLDDLHLYIHPSKQEGLPRVVIEALSRGRIVLGSTAAGIPELLDSKYLHKSGNWRELGQQILSIYKNPNDWITISKKNWERSSEYNEGFLQNKRVKFIKCSLK